MSQNEINLIVSYLKPEYVMLEWGCGGSTTFFSKYVSEYFSIEHNKNWYDKVKKETKENVHMFHIPKNGKFDNKRVNKYEDLEKSGRSQEFKDYIHYPQKINKIFDAVLIDGRARPECAKFISNYITKKSVIFVHDYFCKKYRKHYWVIEEKFKIIDKIKEGQTLAVFQPNY